MAANTPRGYPLEGKREDLEEITLQPKHVTITPKGTNRQAMDVQSSGVFLVGDDVAESGSTDGMILATGHSAKKGDVIRFLSTANNIQEFEMHVDYVETDVIYLLGRVSADIEAADAFQILRHVTPRYDSSGASLASVVSPPIQFIQDGVVVTVTEDSGSPENNLPLPVKLTGVTGDVNITAGDLHVQLSDQGANPDVTRIGNGTNQLGINASNEALTHDAGAITELQSILAKLLAAPSTEAKQDDVILALGSLLTELQLKADLSETQPVSVASSTLPTGAATEATLANLEAKDFATQTTLSSVDTKLSAIQTAVQLLDNIVNGSSQADVAIADIGGAASEVTLSALASEDFATETTLAAMSAKLPASLGAKASADSISVTISNDQGSLPSDALDVVGFVRLDFSSSNVTTSGYTELMSSVGSNTVRKMTIFMSTGTPIILAVGASSSEMDKFLIPPGGLDGAIEVTIPNGTRLSLKSIGSNVTSGQMIVNLMG